MSSEEPKAEAPSQEPVEIEAELVDSEESRVAEMAKKIGDAANEGFKKARPVVVSGAKKGAHLAAVGGRKGARLAVVGIGKIKDLVMGLWRNAAEPDESPNAADAAEEDN